MDSVLGLVRHAGNDALFRAIEMSVLATLSGMPLHLHAEGLRGTGKTTMMRAVRRLLPKIRQIKGCLYHCDPAQPHCPAHRHLTPQQVEQLGAEWVPMPFLEISHSARVGTVVGSIDLARIVSPSNPEAALLPGTVPQAHRGIIFVDEVNRLAETAPELADVLLDVMGTKPGRIQIEETGLPMVEIPVQVTVWAASNPDEDPGPLQDIRRQLSDRFDFGIHTKRPSDAAVVAQILSLADRREAPAPPEPMEQVAAALTRRAEALSAVRIPDAIRAEIAEIYHRHDLESLRAVQAIQYGLRLHASLADRSEVVGQDLLQVVEMALYHRVDHETRARVAEFLRGRYVPPGEVAGVALQPPPAPDRPALPVPDWRQVTLPIEEKPTVRAPQQTQPDTQQGMIHRFLTGLRDKVGAKQAPRQAAGGARDALRHVHRADGIAAYKRTSPPSPGSLYQKLSPHGSGPLPGSGAGAHPGANGQSMPQPGDGLPIDPEKTVPVAPPHPARPISRLLPHELLRTEEELGDR